MPDEKLDWSELISNRKMSSVMTLESAFYGCSTLVDVSDGRPSERLPITDKDPGPADYRGAVPLRDPVPRGVRAAYRWREEVHGRK